MNFLEEILGYSDKASITVARTQATAEQGPAIRISVSTDADSVQQPVSTAESSFILKNQESSYRSPVAEGAFRDRLFELLNDDRPEPGEPSLAEEFVQLSYKENPLGVKEWLQTLCLEGFRNNEQLACGILDLFARLPEKPYLPANYAMALSSLVQNSDTVKEYGIRAFERWASNRAFDQGSLR